MNQKCIKEMIFFRLQSKILIESLIISFKLAIENDVSSQNATKISCIALKLLSCIFTGIKLWLTYTEILIHGTYKLKAYYIDSNL